jgi:hypothetical protein
LSCASSRFLATNRAGRNESEDYDQVRNLPQDVNQWTRGLDGRNALFARCRPALNYETEPRINSVAQRTAEGEDALVRVDFLSIRNSTALAAALFLLGSGPALSQEYDKFEMSVGGYSVYQYDSAISLTEKDYGVGVSFSPRDTLGLDGEQTVFRLDGRYRFSRHHALTLSWYRISSDSRKTLLDDIDWVDRDGNPVLIPIGTSVGSSLGYDIYKIGYLWSFYRSEKVELAAGAGLHLAQVGIDLSVESGLFAAPLRTAKSDLPMPVLSFMLDYNVTPKFNWFLKTQLFALNLGEWSGLYSDVQLGMEYQLAEHLGVGAGIGSNALEVVREYDNVRFEFDNRVTGLHFFVSANF